MKLPKVVKVDFEYFKNCCEYWIEFFGLKAWCVSYLWEEQDITDPEPSQAWVDGDSLNHMATISFNKFWIDDISLYTKENINFIAFHEVCEILLFRLFDLGTSRYEVTSNEMLNARHEICHLLENSVYKNFK
jgi:hypothetical protein